MKRTLNGMPCRRDMSLQRETAGDRRLYGAGVKRVVNRETYPTN